ncbi:hypothetical protein AGMMS50229_21270 [Campylobacterota bacterium]|nr:hypothetical protein AGMMS50229_21270 [Campylobacterota bacterium]
MVFNAVISNSDDHPRNHAFIACADWRLSPAYDLTPAPVIAIDRRDLAMICGNMGRFANTANLLSECKRFMLNESEAKRIIETIATTVAKNWYEAARNAGVSERDCEQISSAFVYQGF